MIKETYEPETVTPQYGLVMKNNYGECCYEIKQIDPVTKEVIHVEEHWVSRYNFPKYEHVRIRAGGWGNEYKFNYWKAYERLPNDADGEDWTDLIDEPMSEETAIWMLYGDVTVEAVIGLKDTYPLLIHNGGTSGNYYAESRVDIYFDKEDSDNIHYEFIRWIKGINSQTLLEELELYDGGQFDIMNPGTANAPQYVKMPPRGVEIQALYKTLYKVTLTNGKISETGERTGFYIAEDTITIVADEAPTGLKFQYWAGDTDRLSDIYNPSTTLITAIGTTNITAVYSTIEQQNSIGYTESSLKDMSRVNSEDVTMISGELEVGTMITDGDGHIYIVTEINSTDNICTIYRLTKITKGGNIYG